MHPAETVGFIKSDNNKYFRPCIFSPLERLSNEGGDAFNAMRFYT